MREERRGFVTTDEAADSAPAPTEGFQRTEVHRWAASRRRDRALMAAGGILIFVAALVDLFIGWDLWMAGIVFGGLAIFLYGAFHCFLRLA